MSLRIARPVPAIVSSVLGYVQIVQSTTALRTIMSGGLDGCSLLNLTVNTAERRLQLEERFVLGSAGLLAAECVAI